MASASRNTGLIGYPVGHSLSPAIHEYWMKRYKIAGSYRLFPVEPKELSAALLKMRDMDLVGFNVTVPHKETILPFLNAVDATAKEIGAVNTVLVDKERFLGTNTDAYGFITNLREGANLGAHLSHVVLLGAGGAARAVIVALQNAGARQITVINRTPETAKELAKEFILQWQPWESRERVLEGASLLVNTTSLGMEGKPPLGIALDALPTDALVTDIVYAPLETRLLQDARARGNPTVDGLNMLIHQAAEAFRLWHGVTPEVTPELRRHVLKGIA